jgi:hypothetical protein
VVGLRQLAADDAETIMKETDGFVWPCTITDPSGSSVSFDCRSNDVHLLFDADTGQVITGRQASVVVLTKDLQAAGFGDIRNIEESNQYPWLVSVDDINGKSYTFKVRETHPDYTLGLMTCILETYTP